MAENLFADAEIIHAYTRAQAIEDGELHDVSTTAKEAGFKIPTAITRAVWLDCVQWDNDEQAGYQDESGRLWDVVWLASLAARRNGGSSIVNFTIVRIPADGHSTEPQEVDLMLHIGPGDSAEPVLTIMFPNES